MNRRPIGNANTLSLASLILAILGIVTMCCIYSAVVFGALAILFGLLSRGQARRACTQGRMGILIGAAAILASVVLSVYSYHILIQEYGSMQNAVDDAYMRIEEMFQTDMDDLYDSLQTEPEK